jgi:hypothetical protein
MYACVKDPETGRNLYADLSFVTRDIFYPGTRVSSTKLNRVDVTDVVTEHDMVETVLWQLRGVVIRNGDLLKTILKDAFGICTESCPELVEAVEERLNEARLEGMIL